jgi:DNA adenine methylase
MAKPFIKWVGGKRQLLPIIEKYIPPSFKVYHEPFLGGGALFFHLQSKGLIKKAFLSDLNEDLICTYQQVQSNIQNLTEVLTSLEERHSEELYYKLRALTPETPLYRAARFIYINKAGFNGLWRVNQKGKCNVPFGKKEKVKLFDDSVFEAASSLSSAKIYHEDVFARQDFIEEGDFVYFDSPYVPLTLTANFTQYTKDGFGKQKQIDLANLAYKLAIRGAYVLLSNADTPWVRELYSDLGFSFEAVAARRAINSDGGKRGAVSELLIFKKD